MSTLSNLVVGVDGSPESRRALQWTVAHAQADSLTLVHGFSPGIELLAAAAQIGLDSSRAAAGKLLDGEWSEPARHAGLEVSTELIDDDAARALSLIADKVRADGIVVGQRGHTRWSQRQVGDVAAKLLHRSDVPVIVVGEDAPIAEQAGPVVVAVNRPTTPMNPELKWAIRFARERSTPLVLAAALEPISFIDSEFEWTMDDVRGALRTQMDALVQSIRSAAPDLDVRSKVRDGVAADTIAAITKGVDASLVVIGSHHPGPVAGFFGASVARHLPTLVTCPTVAVPWIEDGVNTAEAA